VLLLAGSVAPISSCVSAEAHVLAPERFRRSESLRISALSAMGIPLLLLFSQVRGPIAAEDCVVRGGVEPPTFRFSEGLSPAAGHLPGEA
jgi:hypothetical protein